MTLYTPPELDPCITGATLHMSSNLIYLMHNRYSLIMIDVQIATS